MFRYNIEGRTCGIVFSENNKSELGNYLSNKYPELDGKISIVDVWTPLTYNEYYHSYYGSYMGFSITNKANYFNLTCLTYLPL